MATLGAFVVEEIEELKKKMISYSTVVKRF